MKDLKYAQIIKLNKEVEKKLSSEPYELAVLSNITVSSLKDILEYSLRTQTINAQTKFGDYNNIVQDSFKFSKVDLVIVFWELANLIDGLQYKINLMSSDEINNLESSIKNQIDYLFNNLKNSSLVLINKFSSLVFNYQNIRKNNFDFLCSNLNNYLESQIKENVILIEIDKILAKVGIENSIDFRYYYTSKSLYSIDFYKEYANFINPIIVSAKGLSKKVLIFDCDNTLWKGTLGEDGFNGLKMSSKTHEGIVFEEVQALVSDMINKGVLTCICSKNNWDDVEEVIRKHPDFQLKDNIIIKKINWDDKAKNIISIAKELNLDLSSFVFVDDSDFEINFIKSSLPQVLSLQVPKKTFNYPKIIRELNNVFFSISSSKEDSNRTKIYKDQQNREQIKNSFDNLEEYLKSLELKVFVYENNANFISRLAQLTQKTNQFNLTTKRYTESDIKNFLENKSSIVFAFEVFDKFGNNGITGLAIIDLSEKNAIIDTFLMSCRIIGRNIEFAFFDYLIKYLKEKGINTIKAKYVKTLKNEQVSKFYDSLGFSIIDENKEKTYELDIKNYSFKDFSYIEVEDGRAY